MKIFGMTFGGDQPVYNPEVQRLVEAEAYIESQWRSGLTRHYEAGAVVDSVEEKAGVTLTPEEAVGVVERVRLRHGWPARPHASYFPSEE